MDALETTAARALRVLLDSQPTTPAKVAFAWRMSAGPALGRATSVEWRPDGVLIVRASTPAWLKELRHNRPLLTARVRELVGPDVVKRMIIE